MEEIKNLGKKLLGEKITIDYTYTFPLKRCEQTLRIIIGETKQTPIIKKPRALIERNYGIYTGKNKWEIQKKLGPKKFKELRRGWNVPIPRGETLKDVYAREIPYYKKEILPKLKGQKNIMIVSSNNALRAIIKYIEKIPVEKIPHVELTTGEARIYTIDSRGSVLRKKIINKNKRKV